MIATFGTQASGDIPLAAPLSYRLPADPPSTGTGGSTVQQARVRQGPARVVQRARVQPEVDRHGWFDGYRLWVSSRARVRQAPARGTGTGSSSSTTSSSPPAQSPTSGGSSTGSHKVTHKKTVSHPAPKPSHAKKPAKHVTKKATPHAKPKPKVQVHVVSHPAHKVVKVSTSSTSAQKHAHVVDLALQDIHVNLLRKKSHG